MPLIGGRGLKVTNKRERRGKKRERKKSEHSYVFILPNLEILNDKKRLPRGGCSSASHDRQRRALSRAEVALRTVFINPARCVKSVFHSIITLQNRQTVFQLAGICSVILPCLASQESCCSYL